jgi:hypothetical protein
LNKKVFVAADFDGFTSIGDNAFHQKQLTSVTLSNNIKAIGKDSFSNNNISKFDFGTSLVSIGANAFNHNILTEVILPETLTTMGERAFADMFGKLAVTIPGSLKEVPNFAFANSGLMKLTISEGVTSIGVNSFELHELKVLVIPKSVTTIGDNAFASGDYTFTDITLPEVFDTDAERTRIGLPLAVKQLAFPLLVDSTLILKLK